MTEGARLDRIDDKLDKLTDAVSHLTASQEQTVKNVDMLTTDLRQIAKERCSASACARMGDRIDKLETRKTCPIEAHVGALNGMDGRVKDLESSRAWLVKTILGALLIGCVGLLFYFVKV